MVCSSRRWPPESSLWTPTSRLPTRACPRRAASSLKLTPLRPRTSSAGLRCLRKTPPRKVPVAEREERRRAAAAVLGGVSLTGELDISGRLLGLAIQMLEDNTLRQLSWADCTKRSSELAGLEKDPVWAASPDGSIRLRMLDKASPADASCELRLQYALRRRGLALHMADVLGFLLHDVPIELLFEPPEGYVRVGLSHGGPG